MFSMFKKASDKEEIVLSELNEGQLTQVAGGCDNGSYKSDSSSDGGNSWNKWHAPMHHHHHHKHKMWKKMATSSSHPTKWNSWSQPTKW